MKAWILHEKGEMHYEKVKEPVLKENEVLVRVKAAGICGSDIPRIYQTGAHKMPLILGHEFSGQVVKTGSAESKKWINKRVGIFPLIPCQTCIVCQKEQYEMCRNYSYLGSRQNGGFAEYVAVPQENLIELPENVSYEEAAMLEPMAVAVHAMRRVMPTEKDTVVICGLGTIGILLLMFLKDVGVKHILVVGNKEFQKQTILKLGLPEECYCDGRNQDVNAWIMNNTNGVGANVFFECVGKNETFMQAINLTAPAGRVCLVGNPYSDMGLDKQIYWKILRNQLIITGTWNSSFTGKEDDDWHYVLKCLEEKRIEPRMLISHEFSLEELEQGFFVMRDKSEDYIKIMAIIRN